MNLACEDVRAFHLAAITIPLRGTSRLPLGTGVSLADALTIVTARRSRNHHV